MNIILLSGGSGKRLWPISNDVRSKQFIKLLKGVTGDYESMLQRVYRQIREVDPQARVTIATSVTQVSSIRNQLGDCVEVCVEPCRRDTCPAILLAAVHLYDVQHVDPQESVVICPVDPYVDTEYYRTVARLCDYARTGEAHLTLMGIEPTVPSEKYGYIIPETNEKVSRVKEFKEKPDAKSAERYIREGALWNAGVFACQLKYLLDIAHTMTDFSDYKDLFTRYENMEKISFDYGVVEKEPNIQVVRYKGEWRDIGTWNMMCEVMRTPIYGNAIIDEASTHVHVVNELEIPILCMGCHNMVIAASSDGILVADKAESGRMKPYVEKLAGDARYEEKSWGTYTVMDAQKGAVTVKVSLQAGKGMSYHSHDFRDEIWNVINGKGIVTVDGMEQVVQAGDVVTIAAGCRHTIKALTDMQIIEVQIGSVIDVEDKRVY